MLNKTDNQTLLDALQSTTMLAALRATSLGLRRQDKTTSQEVTQQAGAAPNAVSASLNRLAGADALHKQIVQVQSEARLVFNALTSPWDADGWRLLPATLFEKLAQDMSPFSKRMTELKDQLEQEAPQIIARVNLGSLAGRVTPPTAEEMVGAYSMKTEFQPIPDGAHIGAVALPPQTVARLQAHIHARVAEKASAALLEPAQRAAEALTNMVNRLAAYDERERQEAAGVDMGRTGVFRDSLIEHVRDSARLLGAFNVMGDPAFAEIALGVQQLTQTLDPNALRKSPLGRAATQKDAQEIMDKLRAYGA